MPITAKGSLTYQIRINQILLNYLDSSRYQFHIWIRCSLTWIETWGFLSEEIHKGEPEEQQLIFMDAPSNSQGAVNAWKYHQKRAFRDFLFTYI